MSVLDVGLDVVGVERFAARLAQDGAAASMFTPAEVADAEFGPGDPALRLAGRYAAKQAFLKAWAGARLGRPPTVARPDLRAVEVRLDGDGRPSLVLHGELGEEFASLGVQLELRGEVASHVSLSSDAGVAAAVVVLSVSPLAG